MAGERRAVLIGSNRCGRNIRLPSLRYAEDDARALRDVLTDDQIGTFNPRDVELLVGDRAGWRATKQKLRQLVLDSHPSDVLLVFFAGHAFVPAWARQSDAYLVTPDLDLDALRLDPDAGLRMAFLKRDIFEAFEGTSFLILDCCNAGAYIEADNRYVEEIGTYGQIDRHSALLSCPMGGVARESDDLRHGVVTHHILRALRGEAVDADGRVSFARMADYAVGQGIQPPLGQLVRMWGQTTVLTKPAASRYHPDQPLTAPVSPARGEFCENPLDRCASSIRQLLQRVFPGEIRTPRQGGPAYGAAAERIRAAVDADSVAVLEYTAAGYTVINSTARFHQGELEALLAESRTRAFPADPTRIGQVVSDDAGRRLLCVPLRHDDIRALVLAVVDPAPSLLDMGEPLGTLLQAIWNADVVGDPHFAEVQVLTALRSNFGRLPSGLYEHCFNLYRSLLGSLTMVFQPVISLGRRPSVVTVHSYEALARRTESDTRAPLPILEVAHAWGERFIIERDSLLLAKAIESYMQADASGPGRDTKPVSVNVAVRSLLSDAYIDLVRKTLDQAELDPSIITLEISERDPIEPSPGEEWPVKPLIYFHRRLTTLARDLEIGFAVDDFGVGYSSLARMAELPLTTIKVDRAVLHHPLAADELDLVMQIARYHLGSSPKARTVIVEGFDDDSPVRLHDIFAKGIRYVQGHISGVTASTSLAALDAVDRERIAALVRGDDDEHSAATPARGRG